MARKPANKHSPNWGGSRPGAGAKPKTTGTAVVMASAAAPAEPKQSGISQRMIAQVIEASENHAKARARRPELSPFQLPAFPPKAMPPKKMRMAMDDGINWANTEWVGGAGFTPGGVAAEGLIFLGYPYLAELAQRPEYRVISETIATEMTRKWIKFSSVGAGKAKKAGEENPDTDKKDAEKTEKIKELTDFLDHLQVRDAFADLATQDGFFGRSHLFLDDGNDGRNVDELKTPIGDGRDRLAGKKIGKGWLKAVRTIEAVWAYPTTYNAQNPLRADWYNPQVWYVMGQEIHKSRLLTFIGRPVPDLLKPAYSFGGLSLSQMAQPYVNIWLQTRESIAALIHSFSVMVLSTDIQTILQPNNAGGLIARAAMFNALRDNQGLMMINKATEDFKNVSASLSGLHELQAQAQEHMASVARIPLVKFTGISPSGLNASSEGEMRAFYDTIAAYQNKFFRPNLNTLVSIAQVTLWGQADPEITYDFVPLWEITEKERGELKKAEAETAQIDIDAGAISPAERRKVIASDPDSQYQGIDPDDVPDLREEEMQGLEPEGGRPDPLALKPDAEAEENETPRLPGTPKSKKQKVDKSLDPTIE